MRRLFVVLGKLLGILAVYWALIIIPQVAFAISILGAESEVPPIVTLVSMLVAFFASLCLGILLLFKTETIATFLRIPPDTENATASPDALLQTGLILIGVYMLVNALPQFLSFLTEILMKYDRNLPYKMQVELHNVYTIGRFLSLALEILMSIYLVVLSKPATRFIMKYQRGT